MKKHTHFLVQCILLIVLLMAVMLQGVVRFVDFKPLNGVTDPLEKVDFSFQTYIDGSYQQYLDKYAKQHTGFRELIIVNYNQLQWDGFRKTNVGSITVGKDGWLYEKEYVDDLLGQRMYEFADSPQSLKNRLVTEASRISKVQEILAEYDKHLFVIMEPGKTRTYPEFLPERLLEGTQGAICAADLYPAIFDSLGVHYLNFDRWFIDNKDKVNYRLYPQTGTHWSNVAALHVTDSVIRYMEQVGHRNIKNLEINDVLFDTVMTPDDDLELLMNVFRTVRVIPNQYAQFRVMEDSTAVQPTWIHIGDSYYWNISYHIPLERIFDYHHYWYYNSTIYYDDRHQSTTDVNLIQELMSADYVTLGYNTSQLYAMSSHFAAQALVNLCYGKDEVNRAIQGIVEAMNNTPEWRETLQQKAETMGVTLESVMHSDAVYTLYANPEAYFPELSEDHPSSRNKMLCMLQPDNPMGDILRNMLNNPEWMESLQHKAEERQLDLETVMLQDAQWLLDQQ